MTDDKGAGKLAEELFREWWLNNSELGLTRSGIGFHAFTSGFNAGRKAERERCLEIVRQYYSCEMIAQAIEKKILGGQDGK
jgi:hypothetical protein